MKFYYTNTLYFGTQEDAKKEARYAASEGYDDICVNLVEVDTTKANVLRMLNNGAGVHRSLKTVFIAKAKLEKDE